jgi:hypothetical protein
MKRQGEGYGTTGTSRDSSDEYRSETEYNESILNNSHANDDDSDSMQNAGPQMLVGISDYLEEEEDWLGYVMRMEALGIRVEEQLKAFGTRFKNRTLRRV